MAEGLKDNNNPQEAVSKEIETVGLGAEAEEEAGLATRRHTKDGQKKPYQSKENKEFGSEEKPSRPSIKDGSIDSKETDASQGAVKKVRGMATVESTLNSMTGDISYEELAQIPGISTMALRAKENVGEISIFQKKDYVSSINNCPIADISYTNIPLLQKFISPNGRIVPSRISTLDHAAQKQLERCIKLARFLGLLPYVEY